MALIFLGSTTCALCGNVLNEGDEVTSLPPSALHNHPLYPYFDCGFHTRCFEAWEQKDEALRMVKEERQRFIQSEEFKDYVARYGKPGWLEREDQNLA